MKRTILLAVLLTAAAAPHAEAKPPIYDLCNRITVYPDTRAVRIDTYDADNDISNGGQCDGHADPGALTWVEFAPLTDLVKPAHCYDIEETTPLGPGPTISVCPPIG